MVERTSGYGYGVTVDMPYERAVQRTREALAEEGFGVLTEIDVRDTLKRKIDADFRPYVILGACNPPLAHRALTTELDIGLLLPCNVVVYAADEPGRSVVAAMDPEAALSLAENEEIAPVASEVSARMRRVLHAVAESAGAPDPPALAADCVGDGSPGLEECG